MHHITLIFLALVILAACSPQQFVTRSAPASPSVSAITQPAESAVQPAAIVSKEIQVGIWSWTSPELSHGAKAAWTVGDASGSHVYVRDAREVRTLVSASEPLDIAQWWPDGRGLLVWHRWGYCNSCNADGIRLAAVTMQGGGLVDLGNINQASGGFAWNPDGRRLLIGTGGDRFVISGDPKVLVCDVQTLRCTSVPRPDGSLDITPSWSPDGRFVVFARAPAPSAGTDMDAALAAWQESLGIWIARADGTEQQLLDTPGGSYPTWSSDGRTVSFVHLSHRWRHDLYSGANVDSGQVVPGAKGRGWTTYSVGGPTD